MVTVPAGRYPKIMSSTALPSSPSSSSSSSASVSSSPSASSVRSLAVAAAVVLAVFGAFSSWVVVTQGYFGFLEIAGRNWWALQMLLDLVIALVVAVAWMTRDARKRGIATWPYVLATVLLGSIGILAYCVRRALTLPRGT
jgi:hypothetical protein